MVKSLDTGACDPQLHATPPLRCLYFSFKSVTCTFTFRSTMDISKNSATFLRPAKGSTSPAEKRRRIKDCIRKNFLFFSEAAGNFLLSIILQIG